MSLFGKLFSNSDDKDSEHPRLRWTDLTDIQQLDDLVDASREVPVIIFKHSTRCAVSRMALRQFESHYDIENARTYFVDLLEHRQISDEIARRFEVVHQSPQILLIKDGKCIFTESHAEIDAEDLKDKIKTSFV